jgi:hypothetical protein
MDGQELKQAISAIATKDLAADQALSYLSTFPVAQKMPAAPPR